MEPSETRDRYFLLRLCGTVSHISTKTSVTKGCADRLFAIHCFLIPLLRVLRGDHPVRVFPRVL